MCIHRRLLALQLARSRFVFRMLRSACLPTSSATALACRAALPRVHAAAHQARPACHSVWLGNSAGCRTMATTSGVDAPAAAQPDYYRVLGLKRTASSDEVKAAFRDLAKKHHPDVLAASSTAVVDMEFFKLLNEAYKVLSDPLLRREYDSEKFSRATLLRMRNEGRAAAGADGGIVQFSRSAGGGLTAEELAKLSPDEAFQRSVERANERVRDNMRFRATLARANRAKVCGAPYGILGALCLCLTDSRAARPMWLPSQPAMRSITIHCTHHPHPCDDAQIDVPTQQQSVWRALAPYVIVAGIWAVGMQMLIK